MSKTALLIAALSVSVCPTASEAQSPQNKHSCQIVVVNGGTLRANVDSTALTSTEPGAYAGTAVVTTTRARYRISVETPLGFTSAPNGGADDVVYAATFMGHGASNFSERPGENSKRIRRGSTTVNTHFLAKKTTGAFTAGHYAATLTLRCE